MEIDAARSAEIQPAYWCYQEAGSFWCHGFHLTPLPAVGGFDIQSPYGYGGPVANSDDADFLANAWHAYVNWAQEAGVAAEFIRFHPLGQNSRFYGGSVHEDRQTVWVNLQADELGREYQTRVRTAIRKAQKSEIKFSWARRDEIANRFAAFYRAGMTALSASPFYLFDDAYFDQLARWPASRLSVCSIDDEWLSAGLFLFGDDCVEYHLAASSVTGKRLSASNLLLHEVALSAKVEGYLRLYLGGGTDQQPDNPLYFSQAGFSRNRAPFSVGTFCHDAARYEILKKRWSDCYADKPDRLLFYR